jgi:hypothetical protein
MYVYVVIQTAIHSYSNNEEHTSVYAVADSERRAQELVEECQQQVGGRYFARVEEHQVDVSH